MFWSDVPKDRVLTVIEARGYFQSLVERLDEVPGVAVEFQEKVLPFLDKYGFWHYPASVEYHHTYHGGLGCHTVGVALAALQLNDLWFDLPKWKVILAALCHDLGKLGTVDFYTGHQEPRYKLNGQFIELMEKYQAANGSFRDGDPELVSDPRVGLVKFKVSGKNVFPFTYGQSLKEFRAQSVYMDMTDLDPILAVQLMKLPADVIQAIKWADGNFVKTNESYGLKCHPLAYLIHWADFYSGIIKEGGRLIKAYDQ